MKKTERLNLAITKFCKEMLTIISHIERVPRTQVIENLVTKYVEENQEKINAYIKAFMESAPPTYSSGQQNNAAKEVQDEGGNDIKISAVPFVLSSEEVAEILIAMRHKEGTKKRNERNL